MFAYDTLIFYKVHIDKLKELHKILKRNELMLGQAINYNKSSILLPQHKSQSQKHLLLSAMNLKPMLEGFIYIRMPMFWRRKKTIWFQSLVKKISKRISFWKISQLSQVGRTWIVYFVTNVMANYIMSAYKIPKESIKSLRSKQSTFRWEKNRY